MTDQAIEIKDFKFRYRGTKELALDGISLNVSKGEFLVLMGASEAGKSTLCASMNGLIPHYQRGKIKGNVSILGMDTRENKVADMSEYIGMVFQDFEAQLFSTNVELEIAFGPENFAVEREEIGRRIEKNLAYVGLEEFRNRPPSTLSGGQKQKLAIASVLAMQPQVLVMDEPTTDLDPISKQGVFDIVNQLRQRDDITLLVVEHETEETLNADRIALIRDGKIVRVGPVRDILRDVDFLEEMGIMPLGIPRLFNQMNYPVLPLTPKEGVEEFSKTGWKISGEKYAQLLANEAGADEKKGNLLIQCKDLEHTYPNGVKALKGIDLDIYQGEIVAIVGQNGSGKTTLAKHLNALLTPTEGEVFVNGLHTGEQGVYEIGKKVGYVFQNPDHQIFSELVYDEIAFGLRLRDVPEEEIDQRVKEALEAVGLTGFEQEDPFSLTKSGRQRVAVASVLAVKPDVLILDEPTTGLDYIEQRSMMEMVKELNRQGSTIIFVTHHMWVVAEYAKKVFVIKDGKLLLSGSTREVFSKEDELIESFLRPPHFVQFSNLLGKTFLTPDEMISAIEKD
ncbi:MAG: energy-coupling factor transporter ATPase [Chloroflexota bacterium]